MRTSLSKNETQTSRTQQDYQYWLKLKNSRTSQELNNSISKTNSRIELNMIGMRANKPNTMKAYIPERIIFLKNLKENLER